MNGEVRMTTIQCAVVNTHGISVDQPHKLRKEFARAILCRGPHTRLKSAWFTFRSLCHHNIIQEITRNAIITIAASTQICQSLPFVATVS